MYAYLYFHFHFHPDLYPDPHETDTAFLTLIRQSA
jgi:hypothetical protein